MSSKFTASWKDAETMVLSGRLDEDADLSAVATDLPPEVRFDFSQVTWINSCGVRAWVNAIRCSDVRKKFVHCSVVTANQIAMVPEFLGRNSVVESFIVNFVCECCGDEHDKMLVVGKDIDPGVVPAAASLSEVCTKCGERKVLDWHPEMFEEFVRRACDASKVAA